MLASLSRWCVALLALVSGASAAVKYSLAPALHIGGAGRWDYVTVGDDHLLYVTRSTHTQIIDPQSGNVVADIPGGKRLHGTAVASKAGRAFITDGGEGTLLVADLKSHALLGTVAAADDADGIIYDPAADRVLVSCGDAGKMLALDPNGEIKSLKCESVELGGKPEFLAADASGHAFVCLNDKNQIAVVDLKKMAVTDHWPCGSGTSPTGISIDEKNRRLFVGCRNQKLIVMSTTDGKVLAELAIGKGNDACAFDPGSNLAFASCGDGTVAIAKETAPGEFTIVQSLATQTGARTMAVDPATHAIYLPTADFLPAVNGQRPAAKPDSFTIVCAKPDQP